MGGVRVCVLFLGGSFDYTLKTYIICVIHNIHVCVIHNNNMCNT